MRRLVLSRQFNRIYELDIQSDPKPPLAPETRAIRGLRISFEVVRTVIGTINKSRIVIHNPAPATLAILSAAGTFVSLRVGYKSTQLGENNIVEIHRGEVRNVFQAKLGQDRSLTVYSAEGSSPLALAYVNKTFEAKVNVKTIIEYIVQSFVEFTTPATVTKGRITGIDNLGMIAEGLTVSGSSRVELNKLAEEYKFRWDILGSEIYVTGKGHVLSQDVAVINSHTGMVDSPTITEIGADVKTLLNPYLKPNTLFRIESVNADTRRGDPYYPRRKDDPIAGTAEGTYIVQEVLFAGDTRAGDWTSQVKGHRYVQ